jgi:hypothetical protein
MDRRGRNGGQLGETAMSRNVDSSGLYDESVIDDRNERPLMIGFATIVTMWLLAFAWVSVSGHVAAQPHHMAVSAAMATSVEK